MTTEPQEQSPQRSFKLVIYPAVDAHRLADIVDAAGDGGTVVNAPDEDAAAAALVDADAFFGKMTPKLLTAEKRLRWIQAPSASMEHYLFPALVEHPSILTNMRGIFSDVITEHVFGFILSFARNFHHYIRNQAKATWEVMGDPSWKAPNFARSLRDVAPADLAHIQLSDSTLGMVGLGSIGAEVARRGLAFGMRVLAVDPKREECPPGVESLWKPDRLHNLLAESDFVVIAAPHTPETVKMFRRPQFRQMKPAAFLINIGRGVIVDLNDLVAALEAGEIAGAGLDVFENRASSPGAPSLADGKRHHDTALRRPVPPDTGSIRSGGGGQRPALRRRPAGEERGRQDRVVLREDGSGVLEPTNSDDANEE